MSSLLEQLKTLHKNPPSHGLSMLTVNCQLESNVDKRSEIPSVISPSSNPLRVRRTSSSSSASPLSMMQSSPNVPLGRGRGLWRHKENSPGPMKSPGSVIPRARRDSGTYVNSFAEVTKQLANAQTPAQDCKFCNRLPGSVVCKACGHAFQGRVRGQCEVHLYIIHLMDTQVCPECHSTELEEFPATPTHRDINDNITKSDNEDVWA